MKSIGWILLFIAFFLIGFSPLKESDTFMYLALARDFFATGNFPNHDPYILSAPGTEWRVTYEWGGFVFYYLAYLTAGFTGIALFKIALAGVAWTPATKLVWQKYRTSLVHYLLFALGLVAFGMRFTERTSLLADALLVLTLAVAIADWQGLPRVRWLFPVLAVIWINCHGSFPLVWLMCFMWIGGRTISGDLKGALERVPVFGLTLLTPIINPEGWEGITYPFQFIQYQNEFLKHNTTEWMSPFSRTLMLFQETYFFAAFLILAFVFFAMTFLRNSSRQTWPYFGFAIFFFALGLSANRFVSTSVLGLCFLSVATPGAWQLQLRASQWIMAAASLALVLSLLTGVYIRTGFPHVIGSGVDGRMFPVKTVEVLKRLPERGPVWNSFYFGCYLAWELEEKKKIFIHGFVIDMQIFQRYFNGIGLNKDRFDLITQQYNINELIVHKDPRSAGIFKILATHPGWKIELQDEASVLYERR